MSHDSRSASRDGGSTPCPSPSLDTLPRGLRDCRSRRHLGGAAGRVITVGARVVRWCARTRVATDWLSTFAEALVTSWP